MAAYFLTSILLPIGRCLKNLKYLTNQNPNKFEEFFNSKVVDFVPVPSQAIKLFLNPP